MNRISVTFEKRKDLKYEGKNKHVSHFGGKISSFPRKPEMWNKGLERWNPRLLWEPKWIYRIQWFQCNDSSSTHLSWEDSLTFLIYVFFPGSSAQCDWARDPSGTCWFRLWWRGKVHRGDVWLLPESNLCLTDTAMGRKEFRLTDKLIATSVVKQICSHICK